VFEVDGGEWLDFAATDAQAYLRRLENGARPADRDADHAEPAPPPESFEEQTPIAAEPPPRAYTNGANDEPPPESVEAPIPVLAAVAAEPEPAAEAPILVAEPDEAPAPAPAWAEVDYQPDQERRDKFFSRLNRWAKKN
jgi:hypothetical protein